MEKQTTCKFGKNLMAAAIMMFCFMSTAFAQNLTMTLGETWTGTAWENAYQSENTYDTNDYLVTTIARVWITPPGGWENATKSTYTNNATGGATQILIEAWDTDTDTWMTSQRVTNTLNASNQILTSTTEMWIGTGWMNISKLTNTYGGGFLTTSLAQTWDFIGSAWVNNILTTFTNNPDGTVSQDVTQTWDSVGSVWVNAYRSTYTYNGSDDMLTELEEIWVDNAWQNEQRTTNTYDGGGLAVSLTEIWLVGTSEWQNESQSLYTNNPDGTPSQIIVQEWGFGEATVQFGAASWVNALRITFTYSALGVDDLTRNRVVLYPNPAQEYVTVKSDVADYNVYSIIDQQGRTIQNGALSDFETSVDISRLSSGVYFFQIGEGRKAAVKLIKQ